MILFIPPRLLISEVIGTLKGKTVIKLFKSILLSKGRLIGEMTFGVGDIV